ncbi:tail fiber assembly protein [Chromobacterium subtsugae]|uniref:Tail fiber assembly protein n=1 Tax=Chromobacterium subtsugae TaxID=251747 RepID=A0ABS7FJU3_9NEIS|nr:MULTISPECIES: phage tail assembly chaperone [Chromobacterium]KUM02938.1 hypothetical protein Cv017_22725 [Chromobacterium subtsugae]KZE84153.1 hypothetical protein AWB61_05485 [Chromobacterium sp. F49]MBW7568680.1 tail fiber assembly protein [Chromobacterium subtsugae]MBW8290358.1 tail fiber assembly protein [Chromobacterium subtsugae]OBU85991.1 hypothetical protein MY55_13080 [Chromobacterium subtsugae]
MYFSPSLCGFFDAGSTIMPEDAVEIDDETYQTLLSAQAEGAVISTGDDGLPLAQPRSAMTLDEAAEQARRQRDLLLKDALAVLERHAGQTCFGIAPSLSEEQARGWALYAQALRDVPQQPGFPAQMQWPASP